jgi:hypothetical protein
MATYKEIFGKQIEFLSTDPVQEAEGQIWYNSTLGAFKSVLVSEAWSSAAPMIIVKDSIIQAGVGTQASALVIGGGGPAGDTATTEEYNGTGWSAGGVLASSRRDVGGAGTQTSALAFGGFSPPVILDLTEEYDGTTWTVQNVMGTATRGAAGAGTQTAALAIGGAAPGASTKTEVYNGASWTAGGVLGTARSYMAGGGTETAAIGFGGYPSTTKTEEYNGTGWTEVNDMNTARTNMAGNGPQTATIGAGGVPVSTATETFDGTDWTTSPATLATGRSGAGGAGSSPAFLLFGGSIPATTAITEEYNRSATAITAGAWASGEALNTARGSIAGAGIQTAALAISGEPPGPGGLTESYDGSSWTAVNALSTGRSQLGAAGTQAAAVAFGGEPPMTTTETWDGSNWTASPGALNTAIRNCAGWGSQTAAVKAGGFGPGISDYSATVETWNGSAWTSAPNSLPATNANNRGFGTSTAGVNCGGLISTGAVTGITNEWDGSSWTTSGAMNIARSLVGCSGTQTAGLIAGGYTTANSVVAEGYDGTSWSTRPSLATARQAPGGLGFGSVSTAGLVCGGNIPPGNAATATVEVFTGETTAANYKTITTS